MKRHALVEFPAGAYLSNMKLQQACMTDYESVLAFYDDVTERTPEIERFARWQKGKHPTAEDNSFYVKVTEPGRAILKVIILRPPYDGAKDYFYISDVDDRDYLTALIRATIPALPKPKLKKNPLK